MENICKCPHHIAVPLSIALIGLAFLLEQLGWVSSGFVSLAWPILLIIIGLTKLGKSYCNCCSGSAGKCC